MRIRLGTRQSELARRQTQLVADALTDLGHQVEVVGIKTVGDRVLDRPLSAAGAVGLFTTELEQALLDGRVDLAVHSLKDVPTELGPDFALVAYTAAEDRRDVLLSDQGGLAALPESARVGTSSVRRRAFLLRQRPDLRIVEIRGNLNTRVNKWRDGQCDALVVAAAGVHRLGWHALIAQYFDPQQVLPAPGQGILAIEARRQDRDWATIVRPLNHEPAQAMALSERAVLRALGGGCQIPLGAYAEVAADARTLRLTAAVCAPDGSQCFREQGEAPLSEAELLGHALAERLKAQGALAVL